MKGLILSATGEVCHIQVTEYHFQISLKNNTQFLGVFALRKATCHLCPAVHKEQLSSHWADFS
jgi:hypothetical protein